MAVEARPITVTSGSGAERGADRDVLAPDRTATDVSDTDLAKQTSSRIAAGHRLPLENSCDFPWN